MKSYCHTEPMIAIDDWTNRTTSPDQQHIESVLMKYITPNSTILHVGIGNSSLANQYCHSVKRIDGITTSEKEVAFAPMYENYCIRLCNKYSRDFYNGCGYDIIVDNNPASYVCCQIHLLDYFHNVFAMLKGVYLTDKIGLTWVKPPSEPITFTEFNEFIDIYGMRSKLVTDTVIEVKRAN